MTMTTSTSITSSDLYPDPPPSPRPAPLSLSPITAAPFDGGQSASDDKHDHSRAELEDNNDQDWCPEMRHEYDPSTPSFDMSSFIRSFTGLQAFLRRMDECCSYTMCDKSTNNLTPSTDIDTDTYSGSHNQNQNKHESDIERLGRSPLFEDYFTIHGFRVQLLRHQKSLVNDSLYEQKYGLGSMKRQSSCTRSSSDACSSRKSRSEPRLARSFAELLHQQSTWDKCVRAIGTCDRLIAAMERWGRDRTRSDWNAGRRLDIDRGGDVTSGGDITRGKERACNGDRPDTVQDDEKEQNIKLCPQICTSNIVLEFNELDSQVPEELGGQVQESTIHTITRQKRKWDQDRDEAQDQTERSIYEERKETRSRDMEASHQLRPVRLKSRESGPYAISVHA